MEKKLNLKGDKVMSIQEMLTDFWKKEDIYHKAKRELLDRVEPVWDLYKELTADKYPGWIEGISVYKDPIEDEDIVIIETQYEEWGDYWSNEYYIPLKAFEVDDPTDILKEYIYKNFPELRGDDYEHSL